MSSWKKASKVNQKVHRERHQPSSRAHLGLLEKKKDYKQRADDFNKKKKVLKQLKIKALNRNPDEFYFHMVNSKLIEGKHTELKNNDPEESIEQKKLIENKKSGYISMKRTEEIKKINKLQSELHITDIAHIEKSNHIYFPQNERDEFDFMASKRKSYNSSSSSSSDDENSMLEPEMIDGHINTINVNPALPGGESVGKINFSNLDMASIHRINKQKRKRYKELIKRINREKQLAIVQRKVEMLNALKDKKCSRPRLIKQGSKTEAPVYCWSYQRKR